MLKKMLDNLQTINYTDLKDRGISPTKSSAWKQAIEKEIENEN